MRKLTLILFAISFYTSLLGQGNMLDINSGLPISITVCGSPGTFTIDIYNPSPFLLSNVSLTLNMPQGIIYQVASVTGATDLNVSVPNAPVFSLADIPSLSNISITYTASAACDIMAFMLSNPVENNITVDYTANGNPNFDPHTTLTYVVDQPNVAIVSITNQSYSGDVGDIFTRCITITNGGLGELSQFTLTEDHGSGILVSGVTAGTWTTSGLTETTILNGADFAAVGNGNTVLENGESITICETVEVVNCISVFSDFEAFWGCNSQVCQSSISNANVVFPNLIPSLSVTPIASMSSCLGPGSASQQQLRIINTGLGQAINVQLDIFQSTSTVYNAGLYSNIDENSFTIQVGGAPPTAIAPDSTQNNSAYACLAPNPKGRAYMTIPFINPGDTVFLKWDTYSCCFTNCAPGWLTANGWRYEGTYDNICQNSFIIPNAWGRVYARMRDVVEDNGSPSWLGNGQTGTFNFLFAAFGNTYPSVPGAFWKYVITMPPCMTYGGNFHILNKDGVTTWNPSSVTTVGNEITAIFNGSGPWSLLQAEIKVDLTVDCSSCPGGSGTVSLESFFIPDTACSCELPITCESTSIVVVCPASCPEGISNFNAVMERSSFGLPDNDNNGLADPPLTVMDTSKVKTNRAMFGDTISSLFTGVVRTSGTNPSWDYAYASSSITNGNRMVFIDANLTIYQASTSSIFTCANIPVTVTTSGTTRVWEYDMSVAGLIASGCVPGGFVYDDGDSLVLTAQYRINSNPGGVILQAFSTNEFYTSNIPDPTASADQYWCNPAPTSFSIIGYYFTTWGPNSYPVSACNNLTITQNYYLSIGPCCSNYAGGNLFPFEYRNWAHIKELRATLPVGFEYISARFNHVRTAGTIVSSTSPWVDLVPVDSTSDTLDFLVEQFFEGYGGTIPISDDGFFGVLQVIIAPSCRVTQDTALNITYDWTFAETAYLMGSGTSPISSTSTQDKIIYDGPELFLQALLPTINALDSTPSWNISISNSSNVDAMNVWLSMPQVSGVSIVEVYDLDNNVVIPLTGTLFQLDTLSALEIRNLRLTANFTSCQLDSIVVYAGWNCNEGYPADVSSYPCLTEQITLKLSPQIATFVSNVTAPLIPIQLCDTTDYVIEGINIQLGTAYSLTLTIVLPVGATIIPGLSELSYPASSPFVPLSDPVFVGGTIWEWQLSALNTQLGVDGLQGILDPGLNAVKIAFKIETDCNYTSGSIIGFNFNGTTACGLNIGQEFTTTAPLLIDGATEPYVSEIKLSTTFISPCANSTALNVVVYNQGPLAFGSTDSVAVELPAGVTYVPGSFVPGNNAPVNPIPSVVVLNGISYLTWQLPPGVAAGDSTVFSFNYVGDANLLSCDINRFGARTTNEQSVNCVISGTTCSINIITGDTTLPVFTFKANLSFVSANAVAVPKPPLGESVSINYDLLNTGETILAGTNTTISFYQDSDGNGTFSTGDIFLGNDTLTGQINTNSTVSFTSILDVASGNSCSIIAVLDTALNACACNPSQILVNVPLINAGLDTIICSNQIVPLGDFPSNSYSYTWSPITGLDDATIANPQLTIANLTSAPDTNIYIVTTDRLACITSDTVKVIVNPLPLANFSTSNVCLQDSNSFIDGSTSSFGNIVSWFWNFGDASTSVQQNPAHVYNADGTYGVILGVITSTGCQDTVLRNLVVNPLPVPDFTTQNICLYDAASFTDSSTITSGGIASWSWNFGDVSTSTAQNPSHNYLVDSTYQVTLTTVSDSSCTNTITKPILVHPVPIAAYSSINVCRYDAAPFTDQSTLSSGNISQWSWDFGDTSGAIQQNPAHQYLSPGTYNPMLIVTSDSGCIDTTVGSVVVHPVPVANFSTANVCLTDSAQFTNGSTISAGGIDGYQWDFGNGISSFQQNPVYQYPSDGTYVIQLIAKTDSNCVDTFQTVTTIYPKPNAVLSVANQCLYDTVFFNDQSSINIPDTITSWQWDFGDGTSSTQQLPSHLYSADGAYNIELIVGSNNSCADTFQTTVLVFTVPDALFAVGDDCLNDPAVFNNQSTISSGGIDGYQWDFGDGVTSTQQSPQYVYSIDSIYTVQLIVTSDSGCTDTTTAVTTRYPIPKANFEVTPQCLYDPLNFDDTSTGNITTWEWDFGDGSAVDNTQITSHLFPTSGDFDVSLVLTSNNGCKDTIFQTVTVFPVPTPNFNNGPVCLNEQSQFSDASTVTTGSIAFWDWDFGDGIGNSSVDNPLYVFGAAGLYDVTLTVTSDSGCMADTLIQVEVFVLPTPLFTSDTVCQMKPSNLRDLSFNNIVNWAWDFDDGTVDVINQNPIHLYDSAGTYAVSLLVTDGNGCSDSIVLPVIVSPLPTADFELFPQEVTLVGPTVNFTNTSTGATDYLWNFGDFTTSTNFDTVHTYSNSDTGTYPVKLIVFDSMGCSDILVQYIVIKGGISLHAPNAFSPSSEIEKNRVFIPEGIGIGEVFNMQIYNRWGDLIYETDDINKPWDGTSNNSDKIAQMDVYVWWVHLTDSDGKRHRYIGHVTLLR